LAAFYDPSLPSLHPCPTLCFALSQITFYKKSFTRSEEEVSELQFDLQSERKRHLASVQDIKAYHEKSMNIERYSYPSLLLSFLSVLLLSLSLSLSLSHALSLSHSLTHSLSLSTMGERVAELLSELNEKNSKMEDLQVL
jgi:hypothetical protein